MLSTPCTEKAWHQRTSIVSCHLCKKGRRIVYFYNEKEYKLQGEGNRELLAWQRALTDACTTEEYDPPLQQPLAAHSSSGRAGPVSPSPSLRECWWAPSCAGSLCCCEFYGWWPYHVTFLAILWLLHSCAPSSTVCSWAFGGDTMSYFRQNSQQFCVRSTLWPVMSLN